MTAADQLRRLALFRDGEPLRHVHQVPPRAGEVADWPDWLPETVRTALNDHGIPRPWTHQVAAADRVHSGGHTVIATGTASGKSLAYLMPVLSALSEDEPAAAIYLSPTKALAADQFRAINRIGSPGCVPATLDGDTPYDQRQWITRHANLILTNPDMLHYVVLPRHDRWAKFLRRLRYVIIDEAHAYRGVFGSHVALVLRRLHRLARHYGANPTFIAASATTGDPEAGTSRLLGVDVEAVTTDGSPHPGVTFGLWEPPLLADQTGENGAPQRKSALTETSELLADLVNRQTRTVAFVRSRRGVELVSSLAREQLAGSGRSSRIAAYRSGYLRDDRRRLEAGLRDGDLLGVAATNALELGIDIAGLDAVLLCGYPGTLASLWQQAGRAGRGDVPALAVLVARDDPLDTYLVNHPDAIFSRPVEACVLDPTNPYILGPHLLCAADEQALRADDLAMFGGEAAEAALTELAAARLVRRRGQSWYFTGRNRPDVALRGAVGMPIDVIETESGELLGTVDSGSAHSLVHPGAVYLHQGSSYLVDELDEAEYAAFVRSAKPEYSTHPRSTTDITVLKVRRYQDAGPIGLYFGDVEVVNQVVAYQRRRLPGGEIMDEVPLDLPPQTLRTVAVWWTISEAALAEASVGRPEIPGALHAAEHAAIGLLPLVATCDRWDIGGLSTPGHADTGDPTIFVYDGHHGGAGFSERGFTAWRDWLTATSEAISACECEYGCPSCVQSPKCGNGNEPLSKPGALKVLGAVLAATPIKRG
ncbi:DEAD/DEAH box helicase domain-containing protein [Stackebrandtia endophytica]|uniref:DEAD/DEAH box helicase domain-containing protein n=1 Tax=Stackebrandtia endophytica TaxID=1496996 RepID=A0A543AWB9_9ACTN|nr:DEAD/DEAH box helicase [Stackebrandtia endophytica]TQL76862.1 DEAD/DEAH box helicase domain-containing protein [Stackebrandtia endophytica]